MPRRYDFSPQRSFTPYPADFLPEGFRYPEGYLEHAKGMLYPLQFVWWFNDSAEESGKDWEFRLRWPSKGRSELSSIDPIPFARDGEWGAFFDGYDHSGDPAVVVVHLGDTSRSAPYNNFDAWLAAAKKESGIGDPPYDKVEADPAYSAATEKVDGYYFCPTCFEANQVSKEYDDAILCKNCNTFFNIL